MAYNSKHPLIWSSMSLSFTFHKNARSFATSLACQNYMLIICMSIYRNEKDLNLQTFIAKIKQDELRWKKPNGHSNGTKYVQLTLSKLREHGLYVKSEKCEFDLEFNSLGMSFQLMVSLWTRWKSQRFKSGKSPPRLRMCNHFWVLPTCIIDSFKNSLHLAKPLITLTRKDCPFLWTPTVTGI